MSMIHNFEGTYIPRDKRKKILLISDDIRMTSGVSTVSREIVIGTAHHFNWINIGGAVHHPEQGKRFDLNDSTNEILQMLVFIFILLQDMVHPSY